MGLGLVVGTGMRMALVLENVRVGVRTGNGWGKYMVVGKDGTHGMVRTAAVLKELEGVVLAEVKILGVVIVSVEKAAEQLDRSREAPYLNPFWCEW